MLKELKSANDVYQRFIYSIKHENRFFVEKKFNDILDRIMDECDHIVPDNTSLYRARIHDYKETLKKVTPYRGKDIGMPPINVMMANGRVNPKGINYFYLSADSETTIAEVKPNVDNYITIGEFKTEKNLKVIKMDINMPNCNIKEEHIDQEDLSKEFIMIFLSQLQVEFLNTIQEPSKDIEYLPMQYFAEYCKLRGYDGIMYPSSVMEQYESGKGYYNYIFFKNNYIKWIDSQLLKIKQINYATYHIS